MATREFNFVTGIETSTAPIASDPSSPSDPITLGYADNRYVQGGPPVADLTALKALDVSDRQDEDVIFVTAQNAFYRYDSTGADSESSPYILQPDAGSGRYYRVGELDTSGNLVVPGNLTVNGTTTTISTTNTDIVDKNITLNDGGDDASSEGAGLTIERTGVDGSLVYEDALGSKFKAGAVGSEVEIANVSASQTLTNKTIDADNNTISNLAHGAEVDDPSTGVHGVTGAVVGTTDTQTLTNKTLTDPALDASAVFDELGVTPATPSAGTRKLYATSSGFSQIDSAGLVSGLGGDGGSGSGEINVIADTDAFSGDWATSGAGITGATTTTASELPLEGIKPSAIKITNVSGTDYVRYRFTMPDALKNRLLALKWEQLSLGSYASGDMKVELYKNSSSDYLGTYTEFSLRTDDNSGDSFIADGSAPFASAFGSDDSEYYELRIIRVSGTDSLAISNVVIGPGLTANGANIGRWLSYTPTTQGWGSPTGVNLEYRRVADSIEIRGFLTTGTVSATELQIGLPSGLTIGGTGSTDTIVAGDLYPDASRDDSFILLATKGDSYLNASFSIQTSSSPNPLVPKNGNDGFNSTERVSIVSDTIPIQEWSGAGSVYLLDNNVDSANARMRAERTNTATVANTGTVVYEDVDYDTTNSYNSTTGVYTCPSDGKYKVRGIFRFNALSSGSTTAYIEKNGAQVAGQVQSTQTNQDSVVVEDVIDCVAGDTLEIVYFGDTNTPAFRSNANENILTIERLADFTASSAIGFAEADVNNLGLVRKNKWQTKTVSSTVTTNTTLLTFNNLVIGKTYELTALLTIYVNSGGTDASIGVNIVHNSATQATLSLQGSGGNFQSATLQGSALFVAAATTATLVTFSASANALLLADSPGNNGSSFATLIERNDLSAESSDFT